MYSKAVSTQFAAYFNDILGIFQKLKLETMLKTGTLNLGKLYIDVAFELSIVNRSGKEANQIRNYHLSQTFSMYIYIYIYIILYIWPHKMEAILRLLLLTILTMIVKERRLISMVIKTLSPLG